MLYHAAHYDRERPLGTYWEARAGPEPAGLAPLAGDAACEVAIVGGGYTGLSCAYHLAKQHGISAVVLQAGPIGCAAGPSWWSACSASAGRFGAERSWPSACWTRPRRTPASWSRIVSACIRSA